MKPLDRLSEYLGAVERRLRLLVVTRGAAVTAATALFLTILAVLLANHYSFSSGSVIGARFLLFIGLGLAIAAALIVPAIRLNRRNAARAAELRYPQFQERLLTFTERLEQNPGDPFLPLLADDTLIVAGQAAPQRVARNSWLFSFSSAAVLCAAILIWIGVSGGGFLGYGTSLLWGGLPKGTFQPFYSIKVDPGNLTIRKRADQLINATLMGFNAPRVRFFAKYVSASKWEEAEMSSAPGSSSYQFLIVGVPETLDYYVEAGGVRSSTFKLNVVDLPSVKNLKVTYHYPAWAGMPDQVENPGGDLRAVEGTTAEIAVQTDRPLASGAILLDDGSKYPLHQSAGGLVADVPINKDGLYHIAAADHGDDVRLTNDYLIEAQPYQPPDVKVTRPGRDFKATPIEEVSVTVEAKNEFGLKGVDLHYSVNGAPEKVIPLLPTPNAKTAVATATLAMEDYKVQPGDMVSVYATARDARKTSTTDMFFIEMQPFERNYTQSQEQGGGGGNGGDDDDMGQQNQISERQKEIITATWNELNGHGARGTQEENALFLSQVQSKLKDQAKSLSDRMKARQLEDAGDSFKSFVSDMDQAATFMQPASDHLKGAKWQSALEPEQKALNFLLRAEATMRDIQVAFGQRSGGGGGGGANGATRDLQGLFDLELDTEKNQYEGATRTQTAGEQQKQIDDALQKLEQLAKRQQELTDQQKQGQLNQEQRWQQEQLRRDAEQLRQQLAQASGMQQQQLSRGQQSQSQAGGQPSQGGQPGQSGQQSGQSGQQMSQGGQSGQPQQQQGGRQGTPQKQQPGQQQNADNQRLNQMGSRSGDQRQLENTLNNLQKAIESMSKAASSQESGTPQGQAEQRRALAALQDAEQGLSGVRSAQSKNQVEDLVNQADQLAKKQEDVEGQMRRAFGPQGGGQNAQQNNQIAGEKDNEVADLKKLEAGMQAAARDEQATQREASTKMREALSEIQQMEMERDMQRNADYIRKGLGEYVVMSESNFTQGLDVVRDKLKEVQQALGTPGKDTRNPAEDKAVAQGLASLENFRQMLQPDSGQSGQGQQGQNGQQSLQRGQQGGKQGQQGQQGQNGQQGQQGQGQQGKQAGNQQGQQGQQGQGGRQGGQQNSPMGQGEPGPPQGGNPAGGYGYGGSWNNNGNSLGPNGNINPQSPNYQAQYAQTLQNLMQLEQQMKGDAATAKDIANLIQQMRQLDPSAYANDALLAQRIQAAVVANVEQVEMELRRRVDQTTGGDVRSPGNESVPPGYSDATADYFKRLSQSATGTGKQ